MGSSLRDGVTASTGTRLLRDCNLKVFKYDSLAYPDFAFFTGFDMAIDRDETLCDEVLGHASRDRRSCYFEQCTQFDVFAIELKFFVVHRAYLSALIPDIPSPKTGVVVAAFSLSGDQVPQSPSMRLVNDEFLSKHVRQKYPVCRVLLGLLGDGKHTANYSCSRAF